MTFSNQLFSIAALVFFFNSAHASSEQAFHQTWNQISQRFGLPAMSLVPSNKEYPKEFIAQKTVETVDCKIDVKLIETRYLSAVTGREYTIEGIQVQLNGYEHSIVINPNQVLEYRETQDGIEIREYAETCETQGCDGVWILRDQLKVSADRIEITSVTPYTGHITKYGCNLK